MSGLPAQLRPIGHYVKLANEHSTRDPIVYYWCLMYAVQTGMTIDKKTPECVQYLTGLLNTLEQVIERMKEVGLEDQVRAVKKQLAGMEAVTNEVVAQAHLEQYALKLFAHADTQDRAGKFDKNVVKAFYTAGHLFDIVKLFGEMDEQIAENQKYAKWKAAYIHNCLKNGETPHAGPLEEESPDQLDVPDPSQQQPAPEPEPAPAPVVNHPHMPLQERGRLKDLKRQLRKSLFPGGDVAIVVGNRRLGRSDNETLLPDLGITAGTVIQVQPRSLVSSRRYVDEKSEDEEEDSVLNSEEVQALRHYLNKAPTFAHPQGPPQHRSSKNPNNSNNRDALRRVQSEFQERGPSSRTGAAPTKTKAGSGKETGDDKKMRENVERLRERMRRAKEKKSGGPTPTSSSPQVPARSTSAPSLGSADEYFEKTLDELSDPSTGWEDDADGEKEPGNDARKKAKRPNFAKSGASGLSQPQKSRGKLPADLSLQNRCEECSRRLALANSFSCRCGNKYCTKHRLPETHRCPVDFKSLGKEKIQRENPKLGGCKKPVL